MHMQKSYNVSGSAAADNVAVCKTSCLKHRKHLLPSLTTLDQYTHREQVLFAV